MTIQKDYRRLIAEDLADFAQGVLEPEFLRILSGGERPVILGIKYPVHGSSYAAAFNARLGLIGRTNYDYKEVTLENSHMKGYTQEEIREKDVLVIGWMLSHDMIPYLRRIKEEGASRVFYAFRLPRQGGILELEEIENIFI